MFCRVSALTLLDRLVATAFGALIARKTARSCRAAGCVAFSVLIAGPVTGKALAVGGSGEGPKALNAISLNGVAAAPIRTDLTEGYWDDTPRVPSMVLVPPGSFTMGDGKAYCGKDEREVTLTRDFWIGQYEVTNQEYLDWVQWAYDNGYVTATSLSVRDNLDGSTEELVDLDDEHCELAFSGGVFSLRDAGHGLNGDDPMKEVTWYGAVAYCDWLSLAEGLLRAYDHSTWACGGGDPYSAAGYRLPTDAEWEYTAQWDDERNYPWGNQHPTCSLSNFDDFGYACVGWTVPVGSYPAGVQPNLLDPIYDLSGNVWEWANDWWICSLGTSPATDPPGAESGSSRVIRGGGWTHRASSLRAASRHYDYPDGSYYNLGFRLARSD